MLVARSKKVTGWLPAAPMGATVLQLLSVVQTCATIFNVRADMQGWVAMGVIVLSVMRVHFKGTLCTTLSMACVAVLCTGIQNMAVIRLLL